MGGKKVFELMLEIGHKSQPLKQKLPNGYTHKWTVFVRGANNSKIEHCIQRVVFQLHDSFQNPHREITEPPYQVKETGYAGFEIPIEIYFKNREKPNHVVFTLDLCLLNGRPHNSSISEKVKFYNPNREFEKCLVKTGAKMLSSNKDKKERSDSPPAKKQKSSSLIPSKDMSKQATQAQPHSHSTNLSQPSSSQLQPSSLHHNQSKTPQHGHHHGHHNHTNSNHGSNSTSNSNNHFQNHSLHNSNHLNNNNHSQNNLHHSSTKPSSQSQQQSSLPKPKSSKEFLDVFGAPIVYNNNNSTNTNNNIKSHHSNTKEAAANKYTSLITKACPSLPIPKISHQALQPSAAPTNSQSHHPSRSHHKHHQTKGVDTNQQVKTDTHKHIKASEPQKQQPPQQPTQTIQIPPSATQADPLQAIQTKISSLSDCDRLQKIVDIIEESGEWYNLTPNKFEFDLKRLDGKTLIRIEKCLRP